MGFLVMRLKEFVGSLHDGEAVEKRNLRVLTLLEMCYGEIQKSGKMVPEDVEEALRVCKRYAGENRCLLPFLFAGIRAVPRTEELEGLMGTLYRSL